MRHFVPFLLVACGASEPVPLIAGVSWTAAPATADPMPEHDEGAACGAGGFGEELGGVEVDTEICPYAVLQHALLDSFEPGDTLRINWYHSDLVWAEQTEGHLLLTLDGEVLYERTVPIPADAAAYLEEFEPELGAAEGDPLVLHLHNHGFNTWNMFSLERL
ncbi:MAG: hypothetical protein EP330_17655 [Deltaproteobacteria bacterium]|nr:MAG: hypothetical protein EP330_17655 [Deltaproteobacteria bacterium]